VTGASPELRRFLESFHAPRTDRRYADDFHLGALAQLEGAERERAERLLLARLKGEPDDDRIPGALEIVGSRDAVQPLRDALASASGRARLRLASALAKLAGDFDAVPIYRELLRTGRDDGTRAAAARALASAPRDQARQPLLDALGDPGFTARISAFDALLQLYALKPHRDPRHSRLRALGSRLLSDLPSVSGPAAAEVRDLVDALEAGRTPDELDLGAPPADQETALDAFFAVLHAGPKIPFDLDALQRLQGAARRFVEDVLLAELHNREDRIRDALSALAPERAAQPLSELDSQGGS
jgi:hypothetical protein